jgi:hypothetical protein
MVEAVKADHGAPCGEKLPRYMNPMKPAAPVSNTASRCIVWSYLKGAPLRCRHAVELCLDIEDEPIASP